MSRSTTHRVPTVAAPSDLLAQGRASLRRDRTRLWLLRSLMGVSVLSLFVASLFVGSYVLDRFAMRVQVNASILLLSVMLISLAGGGFAAREILHWRRSVRRLARLLGDIRAGVTPMSELDRVGGGARFLIEPARSVLHDLREQKRMNAELNEEMRQRILSRTDALERQLGSLKTQAARDALTGLGNRRGFDTVLPQVFNACKDSHEDLCALMIDVDNFKPLNDTLGHPAGDELLKSIGEIIRSSIRDHDSAFRVGGDEFVILLPRSSKAMGEKLAGRLGSLVEHLVRPMKLPKPPALSVGAAALSDQRFNEARELIDLADRNLYAIKSQKPNRHRREVA